MSNFAEDIREEVGEDEIEAIVIGAFGWGHIKQSGESELGYGEEEIHFIPWAKRGIVLPPKEALKLLDYDYNTGFGAPACHAVYIWTNNRVIWGTQYDGSTGFSSAPRNPQDIIPEMPGG